MSIATPVASTAPMPTYINVALIPLIFLSTLPDPGSMLLPNRVLNPTSHRIATSDTGAPCIQGWLRGALRNSLLSILRHRYRPQLLHHVLIVAFALLILGHTAVSQRDRLRGQALVEESLALIHQQGNAWGSPGHSSFPGVERFSRVMLTLEQAVDEAISKGS